MKCQLGLCFLLCLQGACPRGDGEDLLTGCWAAQLPCKGEAEPAVVADAEDALDVLI